MRSIDADKLILYLNDYALQEAPFRRESADTCTLEWMQKEREE